MDRDGDWRLETDVGAFILMVDSRTQDLMAIQTIKKMDRKPKHHADEMYLLLLMNLEARGACFSAVREGKSELLTLSSRLRPDEISRESVQEMLASALRLSRRLDEVMAGGSGSGESAPGSGAASFAAADAQIAAAEAAQQSGGETTDPPPANWYPDPQGERRLRYWDGQRWTDQTAD